MTFSIIKTGDSKDPENANNSELAQGAINLHNTMLDGGMKGANSITKVWPTTSDTGGGRIQDAITKQITDLGIKTTDTITINIISHGNPIGGMGMDSTDKDDHWTPLGDVKAPWENSKYKDFHDHSFKTRPGILPPDLLKNYPVTINLVGCNTYGTMCPGNVGSDDHIYGINQKIHVEWRGWKKDNDGNHKKDRDGKELPPHDFSEDVLKLLKIKKCGE